MTTYREYLPQLAGLFLSPFLIKPLKNANQAIYCRIAIGIVANIMPVNQERYLRSVTNLIWGFMELCYRGLMVSKKPILLSMSNFLRSHIWLFAIARIFLFSAIEAFILSTSCCSPFPLAKSRTTSKKANTSIACTLSNVKISISNVL